MWLTVNGERLEVPDRTTVAGLVERLGFRREAVAVERNREVVRRRDLEATVLGDGDVLEVVTFVGGG